MAHEIWDFPAEVERIPSPALICFPDIIEQNIRRMVEIAGRPDRLWVHLKTVKAPHILRLLQAAGINRFKCATYAEAEMAGENSAEYVLWAYPLVGPNIPLLLDLMHRFPKTKWFALADDPEQIRAIGCAARQAGREAGLMIDVDLGLHRTGVSVEGLPALCRLAMETEGIRLQGIHAYDGHIHATSVEERKALVDAEHNALDPVVASLRVEGMPLTWVIWGGTPTFPCHSPYQQADLSPGTCVLHDAGYARLYPDLPFREAAMVLTRVISHPAADLFTLDLGYKGLAADADPPRARLIGYEDADSLFQNEEHWTLRVPKESLPPAIGQVLYAIPAHICPTVNLYPCYLAVQHGVVKEQWPIPARNRWIAPLGNR
ncbi:D-TA family PLP-dependent enzyme [Desulfovibrio piger]|uniref:D-TA family PLP-dependent enzyme n=1 Tax=Desulfovibrio piger TaxID=901 RepID=UPI0026EBEF7C|nr:D-TA family PLP-dependent enzyme [Desulfovibrio piger]MDD6247403.1 D-TA family PLP-dependent enzyme [Desulfovibrio piger]